MKRLSRITVVICAVQIAHGCANTSDSRISATSSGSGVRCDGNKAQFDNCQKFGGGEACYTKWCAPVQQSGADQNQVGLPQVTPTQTGQSQTGQSQTGQSQTGQSQTGQSQTGQLQTGQLQTGQLQTGQLQTGQSSSPLVNCKPKLVQLDDCLRNCGGDACYFKWCEAPQSGQGYPPSGFNCTQKLTSLEVCLKNAGGYECYRQWCEYIPPSTCMK